MSDRKPRLRQNLQWDQLTLSAEEGFLLSRIDGHTSVEGLTHLTGQTVQKVEAILERLQLAGALEPVSASASAIPMAVPSRTQIPTPMQTTIAPRPGELDATLDEGREPIHQVSDIDDDDEALIRAALADMSMDGDAFDDTDEGDPIGGDDVGDDGDDGEDEDHDPTIQVRAQPPPVRDDPANLDDDDFSDDDFSDDENDPGAVDDDEPLPGDDDEEEEVAKRKDGHQASDDEEEGKDEDAEKGENEEDVEADVEVEEGNYRKLYEMKLHGLPLEEREKLARVATGLESLALCFDPVPQVIQGLMENSDVGFPHARLIARHHRTPQGLDHLFRRNEFVRDGQTQRYLLANGMLSDPQLKKLVLPKRLPVIYKFALSRDLPEKNRNRMRHILRAKWQRVEGEERAALIFQTEGRVLVMLTGLPFDSKTTSLLCQRTYTSVMLVQSLCRFASTPPLVLAHLGKQMLLKRQPHLRTMLSQHPNCPSDLKRKLRSS